MPATISLLRCVIFSLLSCTIISLLCRSEIRLFCKTRVGFFANRRATDTIYKHLEKMGTEVFSDPPRRFRGFQLYCPLSRLNSAESVRRSLQKIPRDKSKAHEKGKEEERKERGILQAARNPKAALWVL